MLTRRLISPQRTFLRSVSKPESFASLAERDRSMRRSNSRVTGVQRDQTYYQWVAAPCPVGVGWSKWSDHSTHSKALQTTLEQKEIDIININTSTPLTPQLCTC